MLQNLLSYAYYVSSLIRTLVSLFLIDIEKAPESKKTLYTHRKTEERSFP